MPRNSRPQASPHRGLEQDKLLRDQGLEQLVNMGADQDSIEEFLAWRRHRERQRMPQEVVRPSKGSPAK